MVEKVLPLLKLRLGISVDTRDSLLIAMITGIVSDCENIHSITLDADIPDHFLLILDWAVWQYSHPGGDMLPQSVMYRLRNLIVKKAGGGDGSNVG